MTVKFTVENSVNNYSIKKVTGHKNCFTCEENSDFNKLALAHQT